MNAMEYCINQLRSENDRRNGVTLVDKQLYFNSRKHTKP